MGRGREQTGSDWSVIIEKQSCNRNQAKYPTVCGFGCHTKLTASHVQNYSIFWAYFAASIGSKLNQRSSPNHEHQFCVSDTSVILRHNVSLKPFNQEGRAKVSSLPLPQCVWVCVRTCVRLHSHTPVHVHVLRIKTNLTHAKQALYH